MLAAIGYLCLLDLAPAAPNYLWIAIPFLLIGFGVSFTTPAMTFAAIHSVDKQRSAMAAAVLNTVNQIGSLIGVASFGTIVAIATQLTVGIHVTLWISAIAFITVGFSSLVTMPLKLLN